MAGCIFNPKSQIGNFTFFATGAQVEHDCQILISLAFQQVLLQEDM
jgi:hypothetical protein